MYVVSYQVNFNATFCLFASGWALESGQRTTGDLIIDGMQFPGLRLRFVLYSRLILYSFEEFESFL